MVGIRRMGQRGAILLHLAGCPRWLIGISAVPVRPDVVPFAAGGNLLRNQPAGLPRPARAMISLSTWPPVRHGENSRRPRSRHETIPDSWAVDKTARRPATFAVHALLSGSRPLERLRPDDDRHPLRHLLNPFTPVSSMYDNSSQGRELGQLHIVINPAFFSSSALFASISATPCVN